MDYGPYDSSGTDDDLPQSRHSRIPRVGHLAGNGLSAHGGSMPYTNMYGDTDMEAQIHQLEKEAYMSVLRAFKAQADAITWEKESLITELRKELRLSNEEHRELLNRVNADDMIRRIREWRQACVLQSGVIGTSQAVHDGISSPTSSVSRKKTKMKQSAASQTFVGAYPPAAPATNRPSSSTGKQGPVVGSKGRKLKMDQVPPSASSLKPTPFPSSSVSGRGQLSGHADAPSSNAVTGTPDSLIGMKVRTRWPADNTFYDAVITDYDPKKGLHYLVYAKGTSEEQVEWVDLSEISPEDIQWEAGDPGIYRPRVREAPGNGMDRSGVLDGRKARGPPKGHVKREFPSSQNGAGKKERSSIKILNTDVLVKEVERILSAKRPNPPEVEKAKRVLRDHEQALVDAISRLAEISDGEKDGRSRFSRGLDRPLVEDM